jgi:ABC-2 type transport system permease protein
MRTIAYILQKEFVQIFRNKQMLPIIFGMPIVQLLILIHAATFEVKTVPTHIVDTDKSIASRQLIEHFVSTGYFHVVQFSESMSLGEEDIKRRKAMMVLVIPPHFEKDLLTRGSAKVNIILNSLDGSAAGIAQSYSAMIIAGYSREIQMEIMSITPQMIAPQTMGASPPPERNAQIINIENSFWYNPELNYKHFMLPGLLVMLVSLVGLFLSSMNIVKEKEVGTIEQLNVTPIKKYQFIIGKLVPFWMIAMFELAFGLTVGKLAFGTPIVGNVGLVFLSATVYMVVVLGFGLLVSTITETQQQAMFIAWFIMVVFVLMSGLFTPIESMPGWAQTVTLFNPVAYFIEIMRRVLLKGATFVDIERQWWSLVAYAVVIISIAVRRYRKVSD